MLLVRVGSGRGGSARVKPLSSNRPAVFRLIPYREGKHMLTISLLPILSALLSPQTPTYTDIPYMLQAANGAGALRCAYQEGKISTVAADQKIVVGWTASALCNQAPQWSLTFNPPHNALGTYKAQSGTQEIPVRYYPTASCAIDSTTFMVAGRSFDGNTIIERWAVRWPAPMPGPVMDPATQIVSVSVALPSIALGQRVYAASVPGKKLVKNMCAIRKSNSSPVSCLVQFDDSGDVYVMNCNSGQLTLLASAAASPSGTLGTVAGLSPNNQNGIAFGDHTSAGYIYTLSRGLKLPSELGTPTPPPVVIFVDSNRDGVIESALQVSEADYKSQGWWNLANYNNWWLN